MQAIRVTQTLASETLHLPELRPLIGKQVEIIVLADEPSPGTSMAATDEALRYPLRGSVRRYDDPYEGAVAATDWEANR